MDRGQNTVLYDLDQVLANTRWLSALAVCWTMSITVVWLERGLVLELRAIEGRRESVS